MKTTLLAFILTALAYSYCSAQDLNEPTQKQVKFFFPGAQLKRDYVFKFSAIFKEITIKAQDGSSLSGLLFPSDSSKGVIFYLHGNTDALDKWGKISNTYTSLHYDLFMLDYRGYGKSEGLIKSETQLYSDVQDAYNYLKLRYSEKNIVVLGYSIGTGPAAYLAAHNHPGKLILQAPYYSLPDAMSRLRPSFDTSKIAFHFNTYQFLQNTQTPVVIFHGDQDKMFYYGSSDKLKLFFKPTDKLITLKGAGHPFMDQNRDYLDSLKNILR